MSFGKFQLSVPDRSRASDENEEPKGRGAHHRPSDTEVKKSPIKQSNIKILVPPKDVIFLPSDEEDSEDSLVKGHNFTPSFKRPPVPSPVLTKKRPRHFGSQEVSITRPVKRRMLKVDPPSLSVVNEVDDQELPLNFTFVDEYVFRPPTKRLEPEFRTGCSCGPENGRSVGCEYVQRCACLEDAAEKGGKRIGFPYHVEGAKRGCLQNKYLATRWMIYECSDLCDCGPDCRNKLVQNGRRIPLEIFRTRGRGWGLRSSVPLLKGQFIDTYRGEVITDAEADRREREGENRTKDSYLFSLDKFADLVEDFSELYVVDGEFMGGPTRFINHSCDPNCAIFAVSTTRGDAKVYELAFFALDDIPAGVEFTFDYIGEDENMVAKDADDARAREAKTGKLATRCLCGSKNCRGYLWL